MRRVLGHALPRLPYDGPPWLGDAELDRVVARVADGTPAQVPVGAEVRLHGTWRTDRTLDELALDLGGARIDDDAVRGGHVQVRAVLGVDDRVVVERVRGR